MIDLKKYFKKNLVIKLRLSETVSNEFLKLPIKDRKHIENGLEVLKEGFSKLGKVT
jgi:hypothetical protein